jgi:hypothetical protein
MWVLVLVTAAACSAPLTEDDPGWVVLAPFASPELGIRGVAPERCSLVNQGAFDCTELTSDPRQVTLYQMSLTHVTDERAAITRAGLDLDQLPEPSDTYAGRALTWTLYTVRDQAGLQDQETQHVDLGLARNGSNTYLVALTLPSTTYDAHRRLYDTVLLHALYNLEPAE